MYLLLRNIRWAAPPKWATVVHLRVYHSGLQVLVAQKLPNGADVLSPAPALIQSTLGSR